MKRPRADFAEKPDSWRDLTIAQRAAWFRQAAVTIGAGLYKPAALRDLGEGLGDLVLTGARGLPKFIVDDAQVGDVLGDPVRLGVEAQDASALASEVTMSVSVEKATLRPALRITASLDRPAPGEPHSCLGGSVCLC